MNHCGLRVAVIAGLLLQTLVVCSRAGDAAFSRNGERIYLLANNNPQPALQEIDIAAKTIRTIPLTELSASDWPRGITCSDGAKIFLTTKERLWSFDPKAGALTKIRDASSGTNFSQIAFDPKLHATFVSTNDRENPLFMFRNEKEWIPVRMRRHPYPSCLVFTARGDLFFAPYGDLWCGEIQTDNFDGEDHFSVAAFRYAPVATLETENATPAEVGVADIGVSRDAVYVQLSRMGGSGDGWFARLSRPDIPRSDKTEFDPIYQPQDRLPIYQKALGSLKILGEDFRAGEIAVSPDERRVHYLLHGKHWLVTDGKTEELHLSEK